MSSKLLADSVGSIIGTITPIGPIKGNPIEGFTNLINFGIKLFLFVVGMAVFAYLLWGAFEWVTSSGDKEKVSKAQQKLTYAIVGLILVFVVIAVYGVVAGDMLGVIKKDATGNWIFTIPIFPTSTPLQPQP